MGLIFFLQLNKRVWLEFNESGFLTIF